MHSAFGPARSAWRFFPWAIGGAIIFVVAVNAAMITTAVSGFPGRVGRNGFDLSNQYNGIIAQAERAAALGWVLHVSQRDGRPVLLLQDAAGQPLRHARFSVAAQRPVGSPQRYPLTFHAQADGSFIAHAKLAAGGQWDLLVTVQADGAEMHATPRLHMP